jgi:hypothetical protein
MGEQMLIDLNIFATVPPSSTAPFKNAPQVFQCSITSECAITNVSLTYILSLTDINSNAFSVRFFGAS